MPPALPPAIAPPPMPPPKMTNPPPVEPLKVHSPSTQRWVDWQSRSTRQRTSQYEATHRSAVEQSLFSLQGFFPHAETSSSRPARRRTFRTMK